MSSFFPSSRAKRWTFQGVLIASIVGLGAAGVFSQVGAETPVQAAQEALIEAETPGLDLLTYNRVSQLRRGMGLENKDLAALEMTSPEASAVLTRLVAWVETNESSITSTWRALNRSKGDRRDNERLVRIGEATARQIKNHGKRAEAVSKAQEAYDALILQGAEYGMQGAPGKLVVWQDAFDLMGEVPVDAMRYMPSLTKKRVSTLSSNAKNRGVEVREVMSRSETQSLKAVRTAIRENLPGILVSEAVALPLPEELRLDGEVIEGEDQE